VEDTRVNLTAVLLTGLLAGGVSCAAVQGGLLAALIARQRRPDPVSDLAPGRGRYNRAGHRSAGRPEPGGAGIRPVRQQALLEDLTPVGGFLTGKLVSHTLLGAVLGALGATVRPSVQLSATVQLLAGALVIVFGLAQLGVPGFGRIVIAPPASLGRLVLRSARSQAAFAPGLLGLASILIPCGVTLSVEALALASGSAASGAATMASYVIGTSPLFALLGYAARKAATAWRGRLAAATGLVLLAMGLITLNGGLEVAGSPVAASRFAARLATHPGDNTPANAPANTATIAGGHQTVELTATSDGYSPSTLHAQAGIPTTLLIHSDQAQGCVRAFTVPELNLQHILPAIGDTRIELGTPHPGTLAYACGMGMYTGTIQLTAAPTGPATPQPTR
jgi:sulfite exporter TauE/SafE